MDLEGKLTLTDGGNQYICVTVDYFTNLAEAYPLKNNTADGVTSCILNFFYKLGAPKTLVTDQVSVSQQGTVRMHYESSTCNCCCADLFHVLPTDHFKVNYSSCERLGIERGLCSPRHPQTDGLEEKLNGTIQYRGIF